jgi:hypothetical protein
VSFWVVLCSARMRSCFTSINLLSSEPALYEAQHCQKYQLTVGLTAIIIQRNVVMGYCREANRHSDPHDHYFRTQSTAMPRAGRLGEVSRFLVINDSSVIYPFWAIKQRTSSNVRTVPNALTSRTKIHWSGAKAGRQMVKADLISGSGECFLQSSECRPQREILCRISRIG